MKRTLIAAAMVLATALSAHAATRHHHKRVSHPSDGSVIYNRDSRNPNIGWHTVNGWRTCTSDCDNPEIPGSGYVCKSVTVLGMAARQCDR
jgi:hypothetical protein